MIRGQKARLIIVVGGQYGSEGKGKVVHDIVQGQQDVTCVRCGGPNSGHTTLVNGEEVILKALPAGASNPNSSLLIPAGAVVKVQQLEDEMKKLGISKDRVIVDPGAVIWSPYDPQAENQWVANMGSTGSGNGAALIRRMQRNSHQCTLVASIPEEHRCFTVARVADIIYTDLLEGTPVVVEGNQGFGLSMLHSGFWPFCTSRDTTAAGFCSEIGVSPQAVTDVVMCVRTFPIRVGGNSGPLRDEITWEKVAEIGNWPEPAYEYTSVTNRLRRVGLWDQELFDRAVRVNQPTAIAVMGLDRWDFNSKDAVDWEGLGEKGQSFLIELYDSCKVPIRWFGSGPKNITRVSLPENDSFWSAPGKHSAKMRYLDDSDDLTFYPLSP